MSISIRFTVFHVAASISFLFYTMLLIFDFLLILYNNYLVLKQCSNGHTINK